PAGNTRNGKSKKTLTGEFGEVPIEVPRDRHGSFEPQLIPKHQTRWAGFDDKIISLYARGLTVREIPAHLQELDAPENSPSPLGRRRRQNHLAIRPWPDGARDTGPLAGDVRHRDLAQPDFLGDRCCGR